MTLTRVEFSSFLPKKSAALEINEIIFKSK